MDLQQNLIVVLILLIISCIFFIPILVFVSWIAGLVYLKALERGSAPSEEAAKKNCDTLYVINLILFIVVAVICAWWALWCALTFYFIITLVFLVLLIVTIVFDIYMAYVLIKDREAYVAGSTLPAEPKAFKDLTDEVQAAMNKSSAGGGGSAPAESA